MKRFLLIAGLTILFAAEILRVYLIMPFPGSQQSDSIPVAFWLGKNIWWIRILGLLMVLYALYRAKGWKRGLLVFALLFYGVVVYFFNFRFEADKMFYQPDHKELASAKENKVPGDKLVIGVEADGQARAYPIQLIGYHHQVRDTIGNTPVMVTYCTVCRTGRVFSPVVNGKSESFRLVGMDHFNAMFEDATTKSWWRQATGVAIAGALKGQALPEIPSQQVTLAVWMREHPSSTVFQPDVVFARKYDSLADYDNGTIRGNLEHRDTASWQFKSWVIGVVHDGHAKAYDWNDLVGRKIIQDSLPGLPIVLVLEKDSASFHVWSRAVNGNPLFFAFDPLTGLLKDRATQSVWDMNGVCVDGSYKGQRLAPVSAYQEFWHSWRTFHPGTEMYR